MGDLTDLQRADFVKIAGASQDGTETYSVQATPNNELKNIDTIDNAAIDTTIDLTTSPIELKVGANRLANRKYIWLEGLSKNIKWGFSSGSQSFDLFKNQLFCFPIGNVPIYAKVSTGTGSIGFGEGA